MPESTRMSSGYPGYKFPLPEGEGEGGGAPNFVTPIVNALAGP